jgi:hypothetical protein
MILVRPLLPVSASSATNVDLPSAFVSWLNDSMLSTAESSQFYIIRTEIAIGSDN